MNDGDRKNEFDDLWKELTEPRALEGSMSDLLPSKDDSADARDGKAMLGMLVLGRFRIDRFLDGGSVGRIFAGTQLGLGRPVAIKVLRKQDGPRGELSRKRFAREAEFLASMNHPNVVEMIKYGETDDGHAVMIMELLEGHTLKDHLEQGGPMPTQRVLHIANQLAEAVARAHDLGGVHRDLKPANVFIERDDRDRDLVKVLDFGLVKPSGKKQKGGSLTLSGYVLGTPFYMSPEQAMGEKLDARADIYSFGVMIYEMLTGVPPFRGDTVAEILTKHLEASPPALAASNPRVKVPAQLEMLVRRCLAKSPDERPSSMYGVVHELEGIAQVQRQKETDLEASLANWDPNRSSTDFPMMEAVEADEADGDWVEPSIPGSAEPWGDLSQPPLVQPVATGETSAAGLWDDRSGGPAPAQPWDERSNNPNQPWEEHSNGPWADRSGTPMPPVDPAEHPAPLQIPAKAPGQLADSSELFREDALEAPPAPAPAPEQALVPYQEGGSLLPPPSISSSTAEEDEDDPTRMRLWLLLAGIVMILVALGLVRWAEQRFNQPPEEGPPRPRAELRQGHIDSAPTASADMPKA